MSNPPGKDVHVACLLLCPAGNLRVPQPVAEARHFVFMALASGRLPVAVLLKFGLARQTTLAGDGFVFL